MIGLDRFGASAPDKDVFADCGLTVARVVAIIKEVIYEAGGSTIALLDTNKRRQS